jgi:hypothetical protein
MYNQYDRNYQPQYPMQQYGGNYQPYQYGNQGFSPMQFGGFASQQPQSFWGGSPDYISRAALVTQPQGSAMDALLQYGLSGLGKSDFGPIRDQAMSHFYQSTIPSLAERFSSSPGTERSSAFTQALGSTGGNLERDLAALQSQYELQGEGNRLSGMQMGFRPQFENLLHQGQPGMASQGLSALGQFGGGILKMLPGFLF